MTGLLFSNIAALAAILAIAFLRKLLKDKVFFKSFCAALDSCDFPASSSF